MWYGKPAAIKAQINANDKLTFYTLNGDFIGRIADFFAIITLLYTIVVAIVHIKKINR